MAAANGYVPAKLIKEVITLDGVRTVLSKILPQRKIHKYVIVVIPGNPGLIEFYDDFITSLFEALQGQLPVFGVSHAGHSPIDCYPASPRTNCSAKQSYAAESSRFPLSLKEQTLQKKIFLEDHIAPHSKIILIGHSIGAYVILNLLKDCQRLTDISKAILLFPTVERMAVSPNGRFVTPSLYFRWTGIWAAAAFSLLPQSVKKWCVQWWFSDRKQLMPTAVDTVIKFLTYQPMDCSSSMAQEEMTDVVHRDDKVIETNLEKLIFYYGTTDKWVPVSYYEDVKERFPKGEIYLCDRKFDHAFVLESSEEVAEMVASWIQKVIS